MTDGGADGLSDGLLVGSSEGGEVGCVVATGHVAGAEYPIDVA